MKLLAGLTLIASLSIACTKEVDISFPRPNSQLVLNGILHPDSAVRITLTQPLPIEDITGEFHPIEDASVRLFENEKLVGIFTYQDDAYILAYRPLVGVPYTVEAEVEGYPLIRASDIVPFVPLVASCYKRDTDDYPFSDIAVQVNIADDSNTSNYYWLNLLTKQYRRLDFDSITCEQTTEDIICSFYDSTTTIVEQLSPLVSFSTLPDVFNSIIDNTTGGIRQYDNYVRIDDNTFSGEGAELSIASGNLPFSFEEVSQLDSNQALVLNVISASQHYDRYLKSSMIYYLNNEFYENPNPFAEPTAIYSNVENGTGIFAAYNSVNVELGDYPCE